MMRALHEDIASTFTVRRRGSGTADAPVHPCGQLGAVQSRVRMAATRMLAVLGEGEAVRRAVGRPPLAGRGVRVLSMDGGGMKVGGRFRGIRVCIRVYFWFQTVTHLLECRRRTGPQASCCPDCWPAQVRQADPVSVLRCAAQGIAMIRLLRQLEQRTGRRIHELFDLVAGTSTGGILAVALALKHFTLEECEDIYRRAFFFA